MAETQFVKGMEVEVCSDDSGLRGAWFVATVLRSTSKKNKVFVEYHTLMADEKGSKPLREFANAVNLRPIPPRERNRSFEVSDEVNAFHNDGWWEGIVLKVLENSRYLVYFRSGKEELEFHQSELRIHREWVYGLWVPPMEEKEEVEVDQLKEGEEKKEAKRPIDEVNNTKISLPCKKIKKEETIKEKETSVGKKEELGDKLADVHLGEDKIGSLPIFVDFSDCPEKRKSFVV